MRTHIPAQVWPAFEFIREECEFRGWTAADLAAAAGVPEEIGEGLLDGKLSPIDERWALVLAVAFGTSKELWMHLEEMWLSALGVELHVLGGERTQTQEDSCLEQPL